MFRETGEIAYIPKIIGSLLVLIIKTSNNINAVVFSLGTYDQILWNFVGIYNVG